MKLETLTTDKSTITKVFESGIEAMSIDVQELVFDNILKVNSQYKEQQRQLNVLEAKIKGEPIPDPEPPALAFENV